MSDQLASLNPIIDGNTNADKFEILVHAPENGGMLAYLMMPSATVVFNDIDFEKSVIALDDGNLRITLPNDNGEILLLDFESAASSDKPPAIVISEDNTIAANSLLGALAAVEKQISEIEPAAGPENAAPTRETITEARNGFQQPSHIGGGFGDSSSVISEVIGEYLIDPKFDEIIEREVDVLGAPGAPAIAPDPDAIDDARTTNQNTAIVIDAIANDDPVDGDPIKVDRVVAQPTNGVAVLNANGTVTYTPTTGFTGTDTFTYEISDDNGNKDIATITVTVQDNTPPDAIDDARTTPFNTPITINVIANDDPVDGDPITVDRVVAQPTNGVAVLNANGTVTYTPNTGYSGTDTFTYEISDDNGNKDIATVTVTTQVDPNRAPNAVNDSASTHCDTPITINVLANDTDPDGDTLSVTRIVTQPANGTAVLNANGTVTYTAVSGFHGTNTITYEISDGKGGTDTATVTVNVTNVAPNAVNDTASTANASAVTINVLGNDTDPEGDTIRVTGIASNPSHGSAVVNANGTITYTPTGTYSGTDTFTYSIDDGCGGTDTATVTVTIAAAPNTAPNAVNDVASTHCDTPITINVLANDTDPDGDTLSVTRIVTQPANGTAVLNANGTITYTAASAFHGTNTITYEISDGKGGTDTATVTVNVTNVAPNAVNDTASTANATPVTINVLANDTDPEGDTIRVSGIATNPSHGTATVNANGTITYTPTGTYAGTDTFTYTIDDGCGGTDTATVSLTVAAAAAPNTGPIAVTDYATTHCGDAVAINVTANDYDADGDTIRITGINANPSNGSVSVSSSNVITYTPRAGFTGTDYFTYNITDGNGGYHVGGTYINVTNTRPEGINDSASTAHNTAVNINVLANDYDVDGDSIRVGSIHTNPAHGSVRINSNGTITYTPASGFSGTDTFVYLVQDDCGAVEAARVYVSVAAAPRPEPVVPVVEGEGNGGDDCPLVLDLDGDGLNLIPLSISEARFDLDGDGLAQQTAWYGSAEGILAIDRDGDGFIDGINELFGNGQMDGFTELSLREDTNLDGTVDEDDANFADLRIWIDADSDGISDEGELFLLADFNIASIDTGADFVDYTQDGQWISHQGNFNYANGSTGDAYSVWFQSEDLTENAVTIDLTNGQQDVMSLSTADVLSLGGDNPLVIQGDAGDQIVLENNFSQIGIADYNGSSFGVFSDGSSNTLIELGLTVNGETLS